MGLRSDRGSGTEPTRRAAATGSRQRPRTRLVGIIVATLCVVNVSVGATDLAVVPTPRQLEIVGTVQNAGGYITEELHTEFWSLMLEPPSEDPAVWDEVLPIFDRYIAESIGFQREAWTSMKLSLAAGRVVKSPGYDAAKEKVLIKTVIPGYAENVLRVVRNAEAKIQAAADGKPFTSPQGPMYVTDELVDQMLPRLDAAAARLRRLVDPVWQSEVREYYYPEAHVAILSDGEFILEKAAYTAANGRLLREVLLSSRLNETDIVTVTYLDFNGPWATPAESAIGTVERTVTAMGALSSPVVLSNWRGRVSAVGSGVARVADGELHISVRVVELGGEGGSLTFTAVTWTSVLDANLLRETLEQSTQLLR